MYFHRLKDADLSALEPGAEVNNDCEVKLSYENFNMNDCLRDLLMSKNTGSDDDLLEKEIPSGFETIGDIAHLNLNKKQFPHRYTVGQVVIDKNPNIRTVVCKLG